VPLTTPPYKYLNLKSIFGALLLTLSLGNVSALDANQALDQIKSRVINKTVGETEAYFNQRFNELANSFGTGRTEISVTGMQNTKPDFSIKTIQPLTTLDENTKEVTFAQGQITSGENHGQSRNTINLGLGQRYLVQDEMAIAGINLFADYETKSKHKRTSIGLEYQRTNFTANINKYYPASDVKLIDGYTEEVLSGHDVKLTGQMPYAPWATIKGTHYYWDQTKGDNITGNILGVEIELSPSAKIEVGSQNSSNADRSSYAKLSIQLPFKDNERLTNFTLDDKAFRPSGLMDLRLLEMVERSNKIKIEKALNGVTVSMGVFNATTVGASCTLKTSANITINTTSGAAATGVTSSTGLATFDNVIVPTGVVVMECVGGTYIDEATGSTVNAPTTHLTKNYMGGNLSMIAYASPLSEIAYQLANADGDLSDIATQSAKVATAFGLDGIDINSVQPTDLNNEAAGNDASGKVGMALAAIAQMGATDGTTPADTIAALKAEMNSNGGKLKPNKVSNAVLVLKDSANAPSRANINNSGAAEKAIQDNTVSSKGVTVSVSSINTPEEGTATYTVMLDAEPSADVTVTPTESSDAISVSGALTFTSSNWWTAQTVTVTGISDADSTHETATITNVVAGADYGAITAASITATMMDDEAFTLASISNASVAENVAYTSVTPSASNAIGTISYALSGTDAADFTINTSTGVVSMVARNYESPADSGADNVYNLIITATDAGNTDSTATASWAVTVTNDTSEAASFTISAGATEELPENAAKTYAAPTVSGSPNGTLTYTLSGDDANDFSVNAGTGVVIMSSKDFETQADTGANNTYSVTLTATNADGKTASVNWVVTVTDVSEGPLVGVAGSGMSITVDSVYFAYSTIVIGSQEWTKENMRHTATGGSTWSYDDDVANDANGYGKLYDWEAAMEGSTTENAQGICASGWHVPSDDDWKALESGQGMSADDLILTTGEKTRGVSEGVGTRLKSGGASNFDAIFAGDRYTPGNAYYARDQRAYFWTSTSAHSNRRLDGEAGVSRVSWSASYGISVRCIKD
jgi:uncharacterized protein (TIGR02145 family)